LRLLLVQAGQTGINDLSPHCGPRCAGRISGAAQKEALAGDLGCTIDLR